MIVPRPDWPIDWTHPQRTRSRLIDYYFSMIEDEIDSINKLRKFLPLHLSFVSQFARVQNCPDPQLMLKCVFFLIKEIWRQFKIYSPHHVMSFCQHKWKIDTSWNLLSPPLCSRKKLEYKICIFSVLLISQFYINYGNSIHHRVFAHFISSCNDFQK